MAVYTKVSDKAVAEFLTLYDLGVLQNFAGIQEGVENSNYVLTTTKGRYILTLYEKRTRRDDLPFFMGLMEALAQQQVPCPLPVRARDREMLHNLNERPAAVVTFLDGRPIKHITDASCRSVGHELALMHKAGSKLSLLRRNDLSLSAWQSLVEKLKDRADEVNQGLGLLLQDEIAFLQHNWPRNLPQGLIHADLFPDNVFFQNDKVCGLIDFYFACTDSLAYDLAITMNAWCFDSTASFEGNKAKALLAGYEEVRTLTPIERRAMPVLARGAALRFLLTRLYDWLHQVPEALVKTKDPLEYLTRLQFHQRVNDPATYGMNL